MAQLVKNLPAMQETWVPSLGWEDPLEKGMATHSSILAWRTPVHGLAKSRQRLSSFHLLSPYFFFFLTIPSSAQKCYIHNSMFKTSSFENKFTVPLSQLEPWREQKRRKRRFLLCQKPLRKSERISQSLRSSA